MALPLWNSKTTHATPLCLHPNDGVPLGNCGSGHSSNIKSNVRGRGKTQALAEKGGNSFFGLVAPLNPMCADPLRGFVFVLSWVWALLSGCASKIQPPGHPPARTGEAKHCYCASDTHSNVRAPLSTVFFFSMFGSYFQIQRPRRPRARIWGRKKKHIGGHTPRSNVQGALERDLGAQKKNTFGVAPPDPTSRAPSSADLRRQRNNFLESHHQLQRPERPRARIWEGKKKLGGRTRAPRARIWGDK